MNNQNPPVNKLAGLRTFAKDQERANHKTDDSGVGFVVSPKDSILNELSKINQEPIINEKAVTKIPAIEQKLATPKEHKIIEQQRTIDEPKITPIKKTIDLDDDVLFEKKPTSEIVKPVIIPNLTKLTDSDIKINDNDDTTTGATIITDTKKDRFKLFPAIGESIKSWFKELQKSQQEKRKPKYTVPETTRRKGVIQKATSQTGKVATADHDLLQERIRQRLQREIVDFGNEKEDHVIWTPNTEPGFPLLEAGETNQSITNIQVVPRKNYYTNQQEIIVDDLKHTNKTKTGTNLPNSPEETANEIEVDTNSGFTNTNVSTTTNVNPIKDISTNLPTPEEKTDTNSGFENQENTSVDIQSKKEELESEQKLETIIETDTKADVFEKYDSAEESPTNDNTEKYDTSTSDQTLEEIPYEPENLNRRRTSSVISTNLISLILLILIIAILIVSGLGENLLKINSNQPEPVRVEYPKAINSDLKFIIVPETKDGIIASITTENNSADKINQFVFTDKNNQVMKPSSLLIKLDFNLSANFGQSVSQLYFGSIDKTPFIIMKITDQNSAKGGMLNWEKNLSEDLKGILNSNPENTKTFIDGMLSGVDVRLLKNNDNKEEIIYGFVNNNTIIISKDSRVFAEVLELIRK